MTKHIGEKLRKLRSQNGYTQSEVADILGVNISQVSRWERGETSPRQETREQIEQWFGMETRGGDVPGDTSDGPEYKQLSLTFPHADDGELLRNIKRSIREQEEINLDDREFRLEHVTVTSDGVAADIYVRQR